MPNLGYIKKGSKRIPNKIDSGSSLKLFYYSDETYDYLYYDRSHTRLFASSNHSFGTYAEGLSAAKNYLDILTNYGNVWIIYATENDGAYTDIYYLIQSVYFYDAPENDTVMLQITDGEGTYSLV